MCNILALSPGVMLPFDKFENMVNNNPHGFGLILKDPKHKRLEVIRRCNVKGNDPKEIFDLIDDNKDIERYLHVRWRTDGPIDIDNTHPFPAYASDKRQVYFMHNGILHDYKPKCKTTTYENGVAVVSEAEEGTSDSKKFNDEFLAPYLLRHVGENGPADISDPVFQGIVQKFWGHGDSKGLLVSNDQDFVLINRKSWKELDFGKGKFWSSNDTYFNTLSRGPVFEEQKKKREEEAKKREGRFQNRGANDSGAITDLKNVNLKPRATLTEDLSRIFEDYDIWTEEGMASLNNLTNLELDHLVKHSPEEAVNLLLTLTGYYSDLHEKHTRAVRYLKEVKEKGSSKVEVADL